MIKTKAEAFLCRSLFQYVAKKKKNDTRKAVKRKFGQMHKVLKD